MHSTHVPYEGTTYHVHHNGDFSGDIRFVLPQDSIKEQYYDDVGEKVDVVIPFEVIKEVVAEWLRREIEKVVATYLGETD